MKILIITGGKIDDDFAFSYLKGKTYDEVIAVDGGLAFADRADMKITQLVGDFDTIDPQILERYIHRTDLTVHQFIPEKDYTDTDIAVKLAIRLFGEKTQANEEKKLEIIGCTGSRMDHVLANLQMLKLTMDKGVDAALIDATNRIHMITGERILHKTETFGKYVSLVPITETVAGITLRGFKYPLENAETHFGESLCVSNELIEEEGYIKIEKGLAYLIESRD